MKRFVFAAVCAVGLGLAAPTAASAAPIAGALDGINLSPIQKAQVVIVTPGRRHYRRPVCRAVTRCYINRHGRRICRTETVCPRRW